MRGLSFSRLTADDDEMRKKNTHILKTTLCAATKATVVFTRSKSRAHSAQIPWQTGLNEAVAIHRSIGFTPGKISAPMQDSGQELDMQDETLAFPGLSLSTCMQLHATHSRELAFGDTKNPRRH